MSVTPEQWVASVAAQLLRMRDTETVETLRMPRGAMEQKDLQQFFDGLTTPQGSESLRAQDGLNTSSPLFQAYFGPQHEPDELPSSKRRCAWVCPHTREFVKQLQAGHLWSALYHRGRCRWGPDEASAQATVRDWIPTLTYWLFELYELHPGPREQAAACVLLWERHVLPLVCTSRHDIPQVAASVTLGFLTGGVPSRQLPCHDSPVSSVARNLYDCLFDTSLHEVHHNERLAREVVAIKRSVQQPSEPPQSSQAATQGSNSLPATQIASWA